MTTLLVFLLFCPAQFRALSFKAETALCIVFSRFRQHNTRTRRKRQLEDSCACLRANNSNNSGKTVSTGWKKDCIIHGSHSTGWTLFFLAQVFSLMRNHETIVRRSLLSTDMSRCAVNRNCCWVLNMVFEQVISHLTKIMFPWVLTHIVSLSLFLASYVKET